MLFTLVREYKRKNREYFNNESKEIRKIGIAAFTTMQYKVGHPCPTPWTSMSNPLNTSIQINTFLKFNYFLAIFHKIIKILVPFHRVEDWLTYSHIVKI